MLIQRVQSSGRIPTIVLVVAFLTVCFMPITAHAQNRAAITTGGVGLAHTRPLLPAGCPNNSGILDSISVPVGQPLTLAVVISNPAPAGGATFELASEDPTIVAAGDPQQAFLPQVFIPEGQFQSNTFQLFGIAVGGTRLDIIPLTAGFGTSSTPTTAWDVSPGADPKVGKFLDANPKNNTCRNSGGADLSTDPNVLATCGTPVQGTVSDGVTQLLMRLVAGLPGTACYQITSTGPPDQGMIPTQVNTTQAVGNLDYGFSFFQAPSNGYGDGSDSRSVQVQFWFTPNIGNGNTSTFTSSLKVVRPPLLLLHGLWSDKKAWPDLWVRKPENSYFTSKGDYKSTHDSSLSTNAPLAQGFVQSAIDLARSKGYAATQADVAAHSMGGLITRLYIGSQNFKRPDNFNMGDVHRLVTLDTPHGGSSFANLLVALHRQRAAKTESTVHDLVGSDAFVVNGAVCDLSENSSGLQPLSGGTSVLSQVVTATGGPPGLPNGGMYWPGVDFGIFHNLHSFEAALTKTECLKRSFIPPFNCLQEQAIFPQDIVNAFRFRNANDSVVALSSQQGGLTGTDYNSLIHFGADKFGVHVAGVTNTQAVATQVFQLLDGADNGFTSPLPGIPSAGTGQPITVPGRGNGLDQQDFAQQCGPGGPMKGTHLVRGLLQQKATNRGPLARTLAAGDPRVTVISPTNGQVFAPADTVDVTVQIMAPLLANDIAVDVPGIGNLAGTNYDGSTYHASFIIPDAFAGSLTITPQITDQSNNPISGTSIAIIVRPTSPPSSLTLGQDYYQLTSVGATASLDVTGHYPNNVAIDLTSSASGTTYQSSNPQVLTVDSEGIVTATGFGTAAVTVKNSGVKAFAAFAVEDPASPLPPQDVTANLNITESGFRVNRHTGFFVQTVRLTNSLSVPMVGPLYFLVTGLPRRVNLINSGSTQNIQPAGSPYTKLQLADGITLQPGASLTLDLQFLNPSRTRISYTPKVFRTTARP